MTRETMRARLMRETQEAAAIRESMKDSSPIVRLLEAAARSIRINGDHPVGKDGRDRLSIAKISAEADMRKALLDMGVNDI